MAISTLEDLVHLSHKDMESESISNILHLLEAKGVDAELGSLVIQRLIIQIPPFDIVLFVMPLFYQETSILHCTRFLLQSKICMSLHSGALHQKESPYMMKLVHCFRGESGMYHEDTYAIAPKPLNNQKGQADLLDLDQSTLFQFWNDPAFRQDTLRKISFPIGGTI